jgi:selenium metabolism protein YedF
VVRAKKALAEAGTDAVTLLVDNITAVQNLEKMAKGTGYGFSYAETGEALYQVQIVRAGEAASAPGSAGLPQPGPGGGKLAVLITSDTLGRGADELGRILVKGFIFSLTQLNPPPSAVIFLNAGARLTSEGANTLPDLKTLEEKGADIFTCGTCANYFKLTESLAVGTIVDMLTILNRLAQADRIITL